MVLSRDKNNNDDNRPISVDMLSYVTCANRCGDEYGGRLIMTHMLWTSEYKVGVDSLDADHITIFSLINHINEAHQAGSDKQAVSQMLKVLIDRALAHFQREETVMKQNGYPDLEAHVEEHRKIVENLNTLYTAYQDDNNDTLSRAIVRILCSWLQEHILESDMRYRPYVQN